MEGWPGNALILNLDGMGRLVLQQESRGQKQLSVDLSGVAEGLYLVQIRADGGQGVWKVVRAW